MSGSSTIKSKPKRQSRKTSLVTTFSLALLALAPASAGAKYFSKGWDPSAPTQKVVRGNPSGFNPDVHPAAERGVGGWKISNLNTPQGGRVLTDDSETTIRDASPIQLEAKRPSIISALTETLSRATGYNITEAYNRAQAAEVFSTANDTLEGFTRLTDSNWESLVEYERFDLTSGVGEDSRVWFIILHGPPRDISSVLFMEAMTNASKLAMENKDVPNVKFARIDFMTQFKLPSRWLVFRPPYLVVATNRGTDLRFLNARNIAPNGTVLHRFIKEKGYEEVPIWRSEWAPGGNRAWMVNAWIVFQDGWTRLTSHIPSWMLVIITGLITQSLLSWLHKPDPKKEAEEKAKKAADAKKRLVADGVKRLSEKRELEAKQAEADKEKKGTSSSKSTPSKKKGGKGGKKTDTSTKSTKDGVEVTIEKTQL